MLKMIEFWVVVTSSVAPTTLPLDRKKLKADFVDRAMTLASVKFQTVQLNIALLSAATLAAFPFQASATMDEFGRK